MGLIKRAGSLALAVLLSAGGWSAVAAPVPSQAGRELRIGFWNLRDLDDARSERESFRRMAQVLHGMDCVALGETYGNRALSKLVNELTILGGQWNKVKNAKGVGSTRATSERYGVLYRSDKLEVRGLPRTLPESWLPVRSVPGRHRLERPPLVCSFATLDGRLDFTLMVANVTERRAAASHRAAEPVPRAGAFMAAEIHALRDLFLQVQQQDSRDDDVVLLGNFHHDVRDPVFAGLTGIAGMVDLADGLAPTTIDGRHTFDHVFLQTHFAREYAGVRGVDLFDEQWFGGDDATASRLCSDHRPLWLEFRIPEHDDD